MKHISLLLALVPLAVSAQTAPEVAVAQPHRGPVTRFVTLPGTLRSNQQATLYAKVPGYLASLAVDRGDRVKAGQPLARLEAPELLATLAKAEEEVRTAKADSLRLEEAGKGTPGLVVARERDDVDGRLRAAQASLAYTKAMVSYCQISAPFDGIVTARFADPGAFIPAATSSSTPQAAALVTLADFSTVRVQVQVPEAESALVDPGESVLFSAEALPGKSFSAKVSRLGYALDETTRTMMIEADVPNPSLVLRPGMYVTARIGLEQHPDALLVPVGALVMEKANAFVFTSDGAKVKKTAVKLGFNDGANVEIASGVAEADKVVLVGKLTLNDGQAVSVK